jgi:UDP-N-acetylglucosamine 4-epimerase
MMSFISSEPKNIVLVGCGFLGKYFLTNVLDGYEQYCMKNNLESPQPIVTVVDIVHRGGLYKFPLLEKHEHKGYVNYKWSSAGDTDKLEEEKILDNADAIVYTAAIADVPFAIRNPNLTWQTNVNNTQTFMEFVSKSKFNGKIIGLSSESVYGHQSYDKLPLKEDETIPNPANIYGVTKLKQEQIFIKYAESYGLDACAIRSATMYGPFGRVEQALPIFIRQIMERKPITLDGDGQQSRDYVYVEDTAHAIELALYTKENIKGEIINVGSGKEIKFLNLIHLIRHTLLMKEDEITIQHRPFRVGEEGLRVVLDITKAQKLLGYSPQVPMSGIDSSGLKSTIEWMANYVLNYDEKEMDDLRRRLYPLRYGHEEQKQEESGLGDIQVSI